MAHQKITYALILILAGSVLLSCRKKLSKKDTTVEWVVVNPVTNTPYVGVPVRLSLIDYGNNSGVESGVIFEGVTNSQGRVSYTFKAYESATFTYWGEIDLNYFHATGQEYATLKQPSPGEFNKNELNELRYEIVPYVEYVRHTKNNYCQGNDDSMKLREKRLFSGSGNWSIWTPDHLVVTGCVDFISSVNKMPMDYIVTEIEVTRQDGSIEHFIDTSYINSSGSVDTIKVYY
jgi:hypothetical protein